LGIPPYTLTQSHLNELQPRPKTYENRQFNVKDIEDEDTRGRVRDTYQELEPVNFSTGNDMEDKRFRNERAAREEDPDDYDYRPEIDGMRVNQNPNFPSLSRDEMNPKLTANYPNHPRIQDNNNLSDFADIYAGQ
tara:strand:- start:57 stop:461 length:405 start_codon:yes stop_codon:yes gene_type:complete